MPIPAPRRVARSSLAGLCALAVACGAEEPAPPPADAALVATLEAQMRSGGIPGLAVARLVGGEVTWMKALGFADVEARRLATIDTPFTLASVSKTITAVALVQQRERGTLSTTVAIDAALGFPARHPSAPTAPITAGMLATHTSGIVDDFIALGQATTTGDSEERLVDFSRRYLARADHFGATPGVDFSYANAGFGVLGAFIEGATGERLTDLTRRDIFAPLGMTRTAWTLAELDVAELAVPYGGTYAQGFTPGAHEGSSFYPATFLRSSVRDLARFLGAVMRGGELDGVRLMSADAARDLLTVQHPAIDDDQAIGFYFEEHGGKRYLGHTGSAYGVSTAMFFLPDEDVGVIVLTNSDLFLRARLTGDRSGTEAFFAIMTAVVESGL